ncbi:TPA: hypothetical protein ACH3X1_006944 [Trebouxia sp. C0004]
MKITKKDMTDAGMSHADANAIMAEVESIQGTLDRFGGHGQDGQTLGKPNLLRGTQKNNPLLIIFMFPNYLTSRRLKSNDVAGCSYFQILDQRNVLPCSVEILSRPTPFACLHDNMNVLSVVTMDNA